MFAHTHRIISQHINNNIKSHLGIELNINSLVYGSIEPDIKPSLAKLAHFKPDTFDQICEEIDHLSQYRLTTNEAFIKFLSRKIGITTHFISDYFCVPHNDRQKYKHNFLAHVKYEQQLHRLFKKFDKSIHLDSFIEVCQSPDFAIKNYLEDFHKEYTNRGESLENDLQSAITASSAVAIFIITNESLLD
ncbi:zinc dependent phospholipase C family protein [Serpentinicella sp. ANB-PHB4]|uniref:zinc dependent phospholipase C family protein n=1 Tax=Serpentinicella sp. ANB-PHB4 TaxID=3074076 RepID=UPI002857C554|nr:zinc dependent phospholipase C family protein [Serpentinicella sp. ANB-PHB4]MDR5659618.1 zinc dependent phospholipase C family protein [Serpentinicella sp. ANB-PHB4]